MEVTIRGDPKQIGDLLCRLNHIQISHDKTNEEVIGEFPKFHTTPKIDRSAELSEIKKLLERNKK